MGTIILILIFAGIGYMIYAAYKNANSLMPENPVSVWRHYFPDLKTSALEFYDAIDKQLNAEQIPDTLHLRVKFSEHGELLDRERLYLARQKR